uniref:Ig-like domain-containing protein n=1 Tax=Denticeps clupeoides TaxID=299321 RepID=A0AAY4CFE8_9TELE
MKRRKMEDLFVCNSQPFCPVFSPLYPVSTHLSVTLHVTTHFRSFWLVHTLQQMYGCEWDDEDGATDGYSQFGYDGEDFIKLDLKNTDWVAARPEAEIIKQKWNGGQSKYWKKYLEHDCVRWIKKYTSCFSPCSPPLFLSLVPPQVSLLQTDPSSPVVCHATGFYPDKVMISWQKDGQDLHEDVDVGETLSNHDGTFQKRAELKVTPDVWKKNQFTCVVEHKSGDPIHMILTEEKIRTNSAGTGASRQNHHKILKYFLFSFIQVKRRQKVSITLISEMTYY